MCLGYLINIIEVPFLLYKVDEVNKVVGAGCEALPCFYAFLKVGYALECLARGFLVLPEILRRTLFLKLLYLGLDAVKVKGAPWLCLCAP